jgi:hypothetical protein
MPSLEYVQCADDDIVFGVAAFDTDEVSLGLSRYRSFLCVCRELRKRLLERHFSAARIKPSLADGLSQIFSNDPDVERRILRERSPAVAGISDLA